MAPVVAFLDTDWVYEYPQKYRRSGAFYKKSGSCALRRCTIQQTRINKEI